MSPLFCLSSFLCAGPWWCPSHHVVQGGEGVGWGGEGVGWGGGPRQGDA